MKAVIVMGWVAALLGIALVATGSPDMLLSAAPPTLSPTLAVPPATRTPAPTPAASNAAPLRCDALAQAYARDALRQTLSARHRLTPIIVNGWVEYATQFITGTAHCEPGIFVGVEVDADGETWYAGMIWTDDGPGLETGP